ncbi:MAG: FxsA family protein [Pseudomonadota bacterium]|nr:FxsA family protein [Pseudomonadota bacterium]
MRYLLLGIVMAFPAADLYATVRVAHWTGVPVWFWLSCSTLAGFTLLRAERNAFRTATVAAMHGEQSLLRGLLDSGRKVLAAFLLLLPGVMSDVMALLLLALPLNVGGSFEARPIGTAGARPRAIEADFRRID